MKPARPLVFVLLACAGIVLGLGCSRKEYPDKLADASDPPLATCAESHVCRMWGWCSEVSGECAPTTQAQCRGSEACVKGGLCTLEGAKCIARGDDCLGSTWCEFNKLCEAREGVCK
jgi:hypothetical protein